MHLDGRLKPSTRYAVYHWLSDDPPESEPRLEADGETLASVLAWCQEHYGRRARRRPLRVHGFLEVFDWLDGSSVAFYIVR